MAVLKRKSYRIGGTLSVADADGFPRHFFIGDEMPEDVLAKLSQGEIDSMLGTGMLREIGAPPPPRPAPEPPRRWTAEEILRNAGPWAAAAVVEGQVVDGPRGYLIAVVDRAARDRDLKPVVAVTGPETAVLVHQVDGIPVATLPLAKLAQVLAIVGFVGAR